MRIPKAPILIPQPLGLLPAPTRVVPPMVRRPRAHTTVQAPSIAAALTVAAAAVLSAAGAFAGPPLVCWPFDIGGARTLPWNDGAHGWEGTKADYKIERLADDTSALLAPGTSIIVRMETIRRAALYSVKDTKAGEDLLSRLIARTKANSEDPKTVALAWFDLGYFIETVKQVGDGPGVHISRMILKTLGLVGDDPKLKTMAGLDGYDMVTRAISMRGDDPEMQYAAALITWHPRRASHEGHLAKAAAGATEGSLLAKNLLRNFNDRGRTLAELRTSAGSAAR